MRTIEKTVYTFDELSDRAKERARDWFREVSVHDFDDWDTEYIFDDAVRLGELMGISIAHHSVKLMGGGTRQKPTIYYSGFSSQGDGASFEGSYSHRKGSVKAVASEAPTGTDKGYEGNNEVNRIARELAEVQKRNFYQLQASISRRGREVHSMSMHVDVERADEKPVSDDDAETVTQCLRDFADWIYRQLEREYEYRQSDEQVDETIRANEYEFDADGNRAD